ncbi:hypothetical protein C8F04DRAFT_952317, partial [Mycena alexandri]
PLMEDAPRTKRRRTDTDTDAETETEPETPPTRSTEYWFDDGNIILEVESTQFRLMKSILSKHSSVFREMFTMPLPADEPTIENCPVVVLSGDTAQDWTLFLGAIFPKSHPGELPTFSLLAAILRLSKKYDFPLFRQKCVRRLREACPTSLKDYNDFSKGWKSFNSIDSENQDIRLPLISLAREAGLPSLLPLSY